MEKFVPFDKLSKRKKRELLAKRRKTWEGLSPVTRRPEEPKAYKREKTRRWGDDDSSQARFFALFMRSSARMPA
ncbi:hypothetical protein SAMN02745823_01580 [Sporobacter termitidis DSM 10068]|uniref:Uncharacterized protein n=1 Tax=Sporobacter termitidis DSM 10068 TaxID=1123282 RepID=A0A1M5X4D3_9FIRM|nr:hypothetical protein [Sporobacter termitidis]SHH94462.1 hypothetical protein SAMN02745823_01580 [Sporobacter termitidis DSM 10068]